jgi:hypothetical protein
MAVSSQRRPLELVAPAKCAEPLGLPRARVCGASPRHPRVPQGPLHRLASELARRAKPLKLQGKQRCFLCGASVPPGLLRVPRALRNSRRAPSACHFKGNGAPGFCVPASPGVQRVGSYRDDHPQGISKSCNLPNLLWNSELHFRQKAYWHDTITPPCPPIASLAAAFWRIRSS